SGPHALGDPNTCLSTVNWNYPRRVGRPERRSPHCRFRWRRCHDVPMSETRSDAPPARIRTNPVEMVLTAARGFCMGAADVVPGVSGGTVALVLGFYDRLIDNVHIGASALGHLVKADLRGF